MIINPIDGSKDDNYTKEVNEVKPTVVGETQLSFTNPDDLRKLSKSGISWKDIDLKQHGYR